MRVYCNEVCISIPGGKETKQGSRHSYILAYEAPARVMYLPTTAIHEAMTYKCEKKCESMGEERDVPCPKRKKEGKEERMGQRRRTEAHNRTSAGGPMPFHATGRIKARQRVWGNGRRAGKAVMIMAR